MDAAVVTANHIIAIVGFIDAASSVDNSVAFAAGSVRESVRVIAAAKFIAWRFSVDRAARVRGESGRVAVGA